MAEGKIKLHPPNRIGGGKKLNSFIAPVDKFVNQVETLTTKQPSVNLVSTTEQMVDQAKSELKREGGGDLKTLSRAIKNHNRKRSRQRKTSKRRSLSKKKVRKHQIKTKGLIPSKK